jgi:high-affinity iron transporter|tara:strand:+ start:10263 stop:11132 length:870 start_codon:yes stop_codon:yes gene_type:complete
MKEFIISFRETLEAALIVGILFTLFVKTNQKKAINILWKAVGVGLITSVVLAYLLIYIKEIINSNEYEKLFEAGLMYLAAGFLFYMILWMNKNINIKQNLESKAIKSLQKASLTGIFLLVFFAIVREGFETALILIGSNQSDTFSFLGFFGGILAALLVGVLIFWRGKKINLKTFFNFTSALLIFFAAGMIAYGTHEIEEFLVKSGNLDEDSVSRVWNILTPISEDKSSSIFYTYNEIKEISYHSLHDKGSIGVFMKGLFGYNSNPNYIEFFLWLISLTGGLYFLKRNK